MIGRIAAAALDLFQSNFLFCVLVIAVALALRSPQLDRRPMHNDEAVNALKIQALWERGKYSYDPDEYHGPALFYSTLPFLWLSPARDFTHLTEKTLRAVPLFFGVLLIAQIWWLKDAIGRLAAAFAGLLCAVSPAMVFYSRYFIHEMLLACFTMLVLAASWRYLRNPGMGWALLAGIGLGLMYATKETFVIALAAMCLAAILTLLWQRPASLRQGLSDLASQTPKEDHIPSGETTANRLSVPWKRPHLYAAMLAALVVSVILFTSFFTHLSGPIDSLRSYMPWLHRAQGDSPHIHPFGFYLQRLAYFHQGGGPVWSEGLILSLAAVGIVAAAIGKGLVNASLWFARFLVLYTGILTLAYSLISYKTPWCMLSFLIGFILLAGLGAVAILSISRAQAWRLTIGSLLFLACGQLAWQSWRANFVYEADRRNPYVYAQTVPDLLDLVEQVKAIAKVHPQGNQMLIKVMAPQSDYWPLPWYLRQFARVGWWDNVPDDPAAPVIIIASKLYPMLEKKPNQTWTALGIYGLRPGTVLQLCVDSALWQRYLESMPKRRT